MIVEVHSTKRRKTNPSTPHKVGEGQVSNLDLYMPSNRQVSTSKPVTRISPAPTHSRSQPFGSGRRTDKGRPSSSPNRPEQKSPSGSASNHSDYVLRGSPAVPEPIVNLVDYNSWEQNASAEDLKQVQEALQNPGMYYLYSGDQAAFLQFMLDSGVENDSTEEMGGKLGISSDHSSCELKKNKSYNRLAALG